MDGVNMHEIERLIERGNYADALRLLEAPALAGTDSAERQYLRGKALSGLERYSEAAHAYNLALKQRPDWPEVIQALAKVAFEHREAIAGEQLERLIELQPHNAEFEVLYAEWLMDCSDAGAVLHWREAIRKSADPPTDYFYQLAFCLHAIERYDDSLVAVDDALARDRDHLEAWKLRGTLVSKCDRPPVEHVEASRRLIELDKEEDYKDSYVSALLYAKEYEEVIREATPLIRSGYADEHPDVHFSRGRALYYLGRYSEALADFEEGFRHGKPGHDRSYWYEDRGNCYAKLGRIDDALIDYNRAIDLFESPFTLLERADLWYRMKRYHDALQDLERSVQIYSGMEENRPFHELRLQCYEALGMEQEARTTRKRLEELPEESDQEG